ncbi:hydantoinase/carbamoylase family amidase [Siccirubricoccus sp. KC 17139]|uniref:Hydantoinase/carbamoylase family amidase n=1 Tax=Siccirubricoccus soli TaxID=2899147 RepID=A0ABT1D860_9PROT|nr:hydantoinase/carbamoylase family amidase [Siccirubricoccus soli]MCO6418117.1 hydantoinase/carbamoylase family amidase [Siccirubricoccus soli]MCP2684252.1 hydantoinase/carbamoylase family amidase [Siccirubricoccus soli]
MTLADAIAAQAPLVQRLLDGVAEIGRDPPGITRDAFGPGENRARALIAAAGAALGLAASTDAGANLTLRWEGTDSAAKPILIGSHLDSVVQGGNFDGAAGVIAGLGAVAALQAAGRRPRAPIEVLALRCEEAVWFGLGLIGSRCLLARLPPGALELTHARTGRTLAQSIEDCGGDAAALRAGRPLRDPASLGAYLEVHIEQAPQLVEAEAPVAICLANPGNVRHPFIRITGADAHTGLPHRFRRDAALAGADLALELEKLWLAEEAEGRPMAVTIGRFHTPFGHHSLTMVSGGFEMSLDLRAYDPAHLAALEARLGEIVRMVAQRRRVEIALGERSAAAPGPMHPEIIAGLEAAAVRCGLPAPRLNSPGSHDANNFAASGVPTGMLLIRNRNGSHNPDEAMETADLMAAIHVLADYLAV